MPERHNLDALPPIPAKRYFTIGEVSELCGVKPHVLRYWEQEFTQLKPVKRRGNRRYYQHHEVLLVRRIRELLHGEGFTISGARHRLEETLPPAHNRHTITTTPRPVPPSSHAAILLSPKENAQLPLLDSSPDLPASLNIAHLRREIAAIYQLLHT